MAMMAACSPAARLWRNPSSEKSISGSAVPRKQFAGARWSGAGVPAVRIDAGARRDVRVLAGKKSGNAKRPRSGLQARRKPKSGTVEVDADDNEVSEKALEALFAQLEMDLNSEGDDGGGDDGDEEFTDEELTQMTKDLEAAFSEMSLEGLAEDDDEEDAEGLDPGLVDMVLNEGVYSQGSGAAKARVEDDDDEDEEDEEDEDEDEEEDDDEEQRMVPLEKWQLRKLAAAVEQGRRNVNIKSLSAELGMDRADVLSFLRDPPPELLLMSAQLGEQDAAAAESQEAAEARVEKAPSTATTSRKQSAPPATTPSGAPHSPRNWYGSKRLKKEHVATFERVYRQTTRPSNSMIENLVNLTHVPRKKVLQWFDDRRAENQPKRRSFEDAPEN